MPWVPFVYLRVATLTVHSLEELSRGPGFQCRLIKDREHFTHPRSRCARTPLDVDYFRRGGGANGILGVGHRDHTAAMPSAARASRAATASWTSQPVPMRITSASSRRASASTAIPSGPSQNRRSLIAQEAQGCSARTAPPSGGAAAVPSATAASLPGVTAADRASRFGAGSTRNMAENGLGESAVDTNILSGDVAGQRAYEEFDHIRDVHGLSDP